MLAKLKEKGVIPVWFASLMASTGLMVAGWAAIEITNDNSELAVHESRITATENAVKEYSKDRSQDHDVLIRIAEKLNIRTDDIVKR